MKLYHHQKLALQYLRFNDSFALFMEQGTGKSIPTLIRIFELYKQGEIKNALIVAPKATMGAWYRDIEKFFDKSEQKLLENLITVINYDSVWRKGKGYDRQWDCIVLDESHFIKNRTSKRSSFLLKLSLGAKYRYILTGTPIGNGQLENIWAQYAFLKPKVVRGRVASEIFGTYRQFEDKYCILNQWWKPYRYINVDELQDIIAEYSYRVTKEECLDLPDKLPDEVYDIELKEPKLYKELHKHSTIEEMDLLAENPLARMVRLRQICSGFINDEQGELTELKCEKLKVLQEFLDGWEKKLVIFCEFRYSIDAVSGLLKKLKIKHVILDGRQKDKQIWRKFQSDPQIQVIICQYQSGSAGIDLYSADTIIFYEPTLRSNTLEQSKDRIHRIGQTNKCSYIHFISKGTIEVAIYKALKSYNDFSEKLFTEYMQEYTRSYSGGRR
jgi:SNF2 family DNA or RNA helicase